jgi:hypothetical protein
MQGRDEMPKKKSSLYLIKYNGRKEEATGREISLLQLSGVKVKILKNCPRKGVNK